MQLTINTKRQYINPLFKISLNGNWNYKDKEKENAFGKPIGRLLIPDIRDENANLIQLQWKHEEILKLVDLYHQADKMAIEQISNEMVITGDVNASEESFLDKLEQYIKQIRGKTK